MISAYGNLLANAPRTMTTVAGSVHACTESDSVRASVRCIASARHLVRLTVSVAYYSLVPAMGWTVDMVFRGLDRRFVMHSVITDCVYDDKR